MQIAEQQPLPQQRLIFWLQRPIRRLPQQYHYNDGSVVVPVNAVAVSGGIDYDEVPF